ncbi:NlpC/P60 family protein [Streptomyces sp. NPDC006314]|uniref:C40 family peptidase n=1 Tax=Streptomyces sp. NPDC006314 TaxID=3154475 RepID=UPI0033B970DD
MAPESRDEVRQRIDSLYDQAENATGNFNATRAMAARTRSRGVPLAKRRGGQPEPTLDEVARQWFDVARAKLGPTVPAAVPADRLPAGPAAPARSRDRMGGGLPGMERGALALPGGEREATGLPGGERAALGAGPSGRRPELEQGADRAVAELTAGPATDPAGRPLAALGSGRTAPAGAWGSERPSAALELTGRTVAEPGDRSAPELAAPGSAGLPGVGAEGPLGLAAPGSASEFPALGTLGSAPEPPGLGGLRSVSEPLGLGTAEPAAGGFGETAVLPVAALPAAALPAAALPAAALPAAALPAAALPAAQAASVQEPRTLPGSAASGRPVPAVSKAGNRRKLATARDLLSRYTAQPAIGDTAVQPAPAQAVWDTGTQRAAARSAMVQAGQATEPWQRAQGAIPGGSAIATAAAPAPPMGITGTATTAPVTDTGSFAYPTTPAPVTDTGSFSHLGTADATGTGSFPRLGAAHVTGTGSFATDATATGSLPLPTQAPESPNALRAAKAIAFARAQIGKPCVWGATGPDSYDCSSLTQAAWKAAGVTLPRAAHQQALVGAPVTLAGLEPGDLILFFDDDRHVGLHVGDGMMVHAPGPGSSIREESIYGAGEAAIHRIIRPA